MGIMKSTNRKPIIGVMGPGEGVTSEDKAAAYTLGQLIAQAGWIVLSGGRNSGVMDAVSKGAKSAGGLTIGILPTADRTTISEAVDIPILTDMGEARNNINVLTSDVILACGMGPGTASEVALALKAQKPVILLNCPAVAQAFFESMASRQVLTARTPQEAIELIKGRMAGNEETAEVHQFIDDDAGYLQWIAAHPEGLVVNCNRNPTPSYLILHKATCQTITHLQPSSAHWTKDYIKICSLTMTELNRWAHHIGGTLTHCQLCNP